MNRKRIYSNRVFGIHKNKNRNKCSPKYSDYMEVSKQMPDAVEVNDEKLISSEKDIPQKTKKKFLGMKKSVGISVAILGLIIIIAVIKYYNKNK